MALIFEAVDYVKVVGTNGDFRYGCVAQVKEDGWVIEVSFNDEGLSKIEYDAACGGSSAEDLSKALTPMEKNMIPLLALSPSTAQIAEAMTLSPITVRAYIRLLRLKLGLDNRTQLFAFAQGLEKAWKESDNERTPHSH